MSVITHELPDTGMVESAVKLTNGNAAEVSWVYQVHGVAVMNRNGSSWDFCSPDEGRNVLLPNPKRR